MITVEIDYSLGFFSPEFYYKKNTLGPAGYVYHNMLKFGMHELENLFFKYGARKGCYSFKNKEQCALFIKDIIIPKLLTCKIENGYKYKGCFSK